MAFFDDFLDWMFDFVADGYLGWIVFALGILVTLGGIFELIARMKGMRSANLGMIIGLLFGGPQIFIDGIIWAWLRDDVFFSSSLTAIEEAFVSFFWSTLCFGLLIAVLAYTVGFVHYYYVIGVSSNSWIVKIKKRKSKTF